VAASMEGAVQGAGAAFAAILKGRSFLRVCGDRGLNAAPAAFTDNFAEVAGGLVYMSSQQSTTCQEQLSSSCGSAGQSGCASLEGAQVGWVQVCWPKCSLSKGCSKFWPTSQHRRRRKHLVSTNSVAACLGAAWYQGKGCWSLHLFPQKARASPAPSPARHLLLLVAV
jgi:hypothetical protein